MLRSEIPVLPDYVTLPQAAHALGMTRQGVHRWIDNERFTTIKRLGDTEKPIYVIATSEIEEKVAERAAQHVDPHDPSGDSPSSQLAEAS